MATYVKSNQFSGETVHCEACYEERGKMQTALGAHSDYVYLQLYAASLGNSAVNTTIQDVCIIPEAMTLVSVVCSSVTGTGTTQPTFDVFDESDATPATILDAPVLIATPKSPASGAIATGETVCAAGRMLGLRCTTPGDGVATHVCLTLTLKKTLTT
jgi:hypothetical protein